MAAHVTAVPDTLNFGGVIPDTFGPDITPVSDLPSFNGGVAINDVPTNAKVTFTLRGDIDHFAIRDVFVLELVEKIVHPGDPDLPPGHHGGKIKVLEVVGQFDGTAPVEVKQAQTLLVRVKYSALSVDGFFSATLLIQGDTWESLSVPLSLFPALVTSTSSDALTIAQGHPASLPIIAKSVMGPGVDLTYLMSTTQLHTGLTLLPPNTFRLEPKQTRSLSLVFQADRDARLGSNQVAVDQLAFQRRGFFISVNIVSPAISVNAAGPNKIRALKSDTVINIPVSISLNGGSSAQMNFFSPTTLPSEVSFHGASPFVENDTTITLNLFLGKGAPSDFSFSIEWTAFGGEQTGKLDYNVTIRPETQFWSVGGQTTPATLGGWAQFWANSDGFWSFRGHVHDSGFFDLFYASLAVLDLGDPTVSAKVFQKDGSVTGTGNPFGSRDDDWTQEGVDSSIADNWNVVKNAIVHFRLHASAEVFDVLEVVLAPFLAEIGVVKFLIKQAGEIDIGGGSHQGSVECDAIVTTDDGPALHCEITG